MYFTFYEDGINGCSITNSSSTKTDDPEQENWKIINVLASPDNYANYIETIDDKKYFNISKIENSKESVVFKLQYKSQSFWNYGKVASEIYEQIHTVTLSKTK
jgi:hypothetical protein